MSRGNIKNVFISHHSKDDEHVDKLTSLLAKKGHNIRNSSIRAKPANQERLKKGLVKDSTIRRLLRMKISWAGSVVVIVGKNTHSRPWVNWEIKEANRQGKQIVGIYQHGLKGDVELPSALKLYSTSLVGWDTDSIIDAINGNPSFQNPDGSPCERKDGPHSIC